MIRTAPKFQVKLADSPEELRAAQRLRYRVFVEELGSDGPLVDHAAKLERDRFDPFFDHLILTCDSRPGDVVGVYRLLRADQACRAGQFYSEDEYDLDLLKSSGKRLLELGRSCLHPSVRGGMAMFHLWQGLDRYVADHGIDILFGVASFHGTDSDALAQPLALLHHRHLAPPRLRVTARDPHQQMNLIAPDSLDRRAAMLRVPALIKAYLKLGGYVGEGAYIDHAFNTTDVCLILDTSEMNARQKTLYGAGRHA